MAVKKVGTLIREARTAKKLSQEQLASGIDGLSGSDIGKAERGEKDPRTVFQEGRGQKDVWRSVHASAHQGEHVRRSARHLRQHHRLAARHHRGFRAQVEGRSIHQVL